MFKRTDSITKDGCGCKHSHVTGEQVSLCARHLRSARQRSQRMRDDAIAAIQRSHDDAVTLRQDYASMAWVDALNTTGHDIMVIGGSMRDDDAILIAFTPIDAT